VGNVILNNGKVIDVRGYDDLKFCSIDDFTEYMIGTCELNSKEVMEVMEVLFKDSLKRMWY